VIDVIVVMLFTHPIMVLVARTKFFNEGHPWSGLDPRKLGRDALYKGRGRVRATPAVSADGLTLAERKAAARRAEAGQPTAADVAEVRDEVAGDDAVHQDSPETKGDAR
jgi:preprotein translocase subunit SecD